MTDHRGAKERRLKRKSKRGAVDGRAFGLNQPSGLPAIYSRSDVDGVREGARQMFLDELSKAMPSLMTALAGIARGTATSNEETALRVGAWASGCYLSGEWVERAARNTVRVWRYLLAARRTLPEPLRFIHGTGDPELENGPDGASALAGANLAPGGAPACTVPGWSGTTETWPQYKRRMLAMVERTLEDHYRPRRDIELRSLGYSGGSKTQSTPEHMRWLIERQVQGDSLEVIAQRATNRRTDGLDIGVVQRATKKAADVLGICIRSSLTK
jgi:hypothetical protein